MLKNFWVWHRLDGKDESGKTIALEFLKEWVAAFPQDKEEIWGIFLATTAGQTVSRELGRSFEETAFQGMIGDYQKYSQSAAGFKKALAEWTAKVVAGTAAVDACVGPEIWITNKNYPIRTTLWSEEGKKPLRVNLNTCSALDLMTFPGLTAEKAAKTIAAREKAGFFRTLDDARRGGFDPGTL
ncbi:MAG: helix-hairpin-helix domain-containing protein [Candidatus Aminicenantales bacterium]